MSGKRTLKTYTVIMALVVVAAGLVYLCWSTVAYNTFVNEKVLAEARTLSIEAASAWDFINEAQDDINYNSDGTYDFKGVYCTIAGKSIARKFTMRSDGYQIRYVRENPRSASDTPDDFELRALGSLRDGDVEEVYGTERGENGEPAFRYLAPLRAEWNCLQCHGQPAGEPDVTGHAKEGMELGDLAGAVSISIPLQAYEGESRSRVLQALVFVVVLLAAAVVVVRLAMRRFVVDPLERENESLHDENRMKTDFLDSVSHDMRTPLTSIIAFSDLWEERMRDRRAQRESGGDNPAIASDTDDEEALMVAEIRANSQILLNMVGNTLDASRLEAGRFTFSYRELDIIDVVQSVLVSLRPVAKKRGISFRRDFDLDVPLVVSDEAALQKIVMNLASNAVKFSPPNAEVVAKIDYVEGEVRVSVSDHGPGVSDDEKKRIFERFAQAKGEGHSSHGGSGLGLYVALSLAESLGASLDVRSDGGTWSTFTLSIPLKPPE